ncbi:SHOCT domain-containing protein [Streptomyces sp. 142MFCol3.1]|uniref:SHOCT domain-containing protein n=1 Tax=Streptomyces sp. 142MFCol3.1 TaxID=1172179 RepID=UPI00048EEEE4|nr:SHOCT domain-containing protein [Streptomyces sp. 142MFCol3.1]
MPGLLRGVARTAVVAGTATAVSNRVSRRQAGRWAQQEEQQPPQQQVYRQQQAFQQPPQQQAYRQQQAFQQPAEEQAYRQQQAFQQPAEPAPAAPPAADDMTQKIDQLKQLADLKAQGVLTEEEFEAQKRRLLG